jgi:hypothetical protein
MAGALALACGVARADGPRFEATPFVGYRAGGDFDLDETEGAPTQSVDVESDASFGLDLGLYRDANSFYELLYSRQQSSLDSDDPAVDGFDVAIEYLQVGGTLLFDSDTWYQPWLSLTIGATKLDPRQGGFDSETKFSGSIGGGFRFPISERVAATLGARAYLTVLDSNTEIFCVSSGGATCLLKSSGTLFFQGEAMLGVTFKF